MSRKVPTFLRKASGAGGTGQHASLMVRYIRTCSLSAFTGPDMNSFGYSEDEDSVLLRHFRLL